MGVASVSVEPAPEALTVSGGLATVVTARLATGGWSGGGPDPPEYSTCRSGASVALPSRDFAARRPLPEITSTIAFPLAQPGRLTTCWISAARSGVRCSAPTCPVVHAAGVQSAN